MNEHVSNDQYDKIPAGLPKNFTREALRIFHLQYIQNELYRKFVRSFHLNPEMIPDLEQIPFLHIPLCTRLQQG